MIKFLRKILQKPLSESQPQCYRRNRTVVLTIYIPILFLFISCTQPNTQNFDYGTQNDSARHYFHIGWQEIMDNGRWTESELAFRKAAQLDPDWALGKSMVARITQNLGERQQILQQLKEVKHQLSKDEQLLLEVNILSLMAANNRDKGIPNSSEFNKKRRALAEKNFGTFARKYPEDDYFKAEYIEFLHLNHGSQIALDSLSMLANDRQRGLGFFIRYEALLELELGHVEKAIELYNELKNTLSDSTYNSPLMLRALIYKTQDSLAQAKLLVDQVVKKDTNHLIAKSMQNALVKQLGSND